MGPIRLVHREESGARNPVRPNAAPYLKLLCKRTCHYKLVNYVVDWSKPSAPIASEGFHNTMLMTEGTSTGLRTQVPKTPSLVQLWASLGRK